MPEPSSHTVQTGTNGSRRRHGRVPARESAGDATVRHRMVRLAVLPAGLIAVAGAAVVAYVMRVQGGIDATGTPTPGPVGAPVWGVLAGSLLLVCAVIVTAAMLASSEARGTVERYAALRRSVARGETDLRAMLQALERGERPQTRPRAPEPGPEPAGDALDLLAQEFAVAQRTAETALAEAAAHVRSTYSGSEEKVEVFVNLARRLQSLVHREIELLDELENEVEDPDLLKGLFHVDHLATRMRRHAENLAVLGGAVSRRQWTRPVSMTEVLRSAIAEVEQYPRVKLVPPIEGTLRGHAVADVIHLLAELIENATVFSAPQTQVLLRAQHVTAGLAIEVEDRGLGMTPGEQNHMNAVLSEPDRIDVPELLQDGRIGLFVVSSLARRHGVVVQLQSNIYGGIQAVLVLPRVLIGDEQPEDRGAGGYAPPSAAAQARADHVGVVGAEGDGRTPDVPAPGPGPAPGEPLPPLSPLPQPRAEDRRGGGGTDEAVPPVHPAPPLSSVSSVPSAGGAPSPQAGKPRLPKRRRQEHLVPELREPPPPFGGPRAQEVAEEGHDPGLMAAFRRGTSLADETDLDDPGPYAAPGADLPSEPSPASGGDAPRPAR
ncbi:sensor histidine kinase [Streptomyces sp. NPDC048172]|uniref:sensor histidine kinase n=1 Tax=Streptomyces sp. NPDC048172 TaxID=3365505 RepID=UPI003723387D